MKFSQETLMAYADGELDAATRRAIEEAMQTDDAIAREIERHRALRSDLQAAFGGSLTEPVPERLIESARTSPAGSTKVADLAAARAAKTS
ncbi:MAG: anti-sigma factor family protein, partial [Steroidobacteraceae bacterium]